MGRRRGGGEGAISASESPLAPRAADGGAVPSARRRAASSAARSCCSSLEPRGGVVKRRGSQAATHPSYGSPYASPYCSFSLSPPPLPRQLTPFPDHAATRTRARGTPHAARVLVEARVAGGVSAGDAQRAQRTGEVVRHVGEGEEREHQDGGLPGPEAGPRAHQRPRGGGQAGGVEWLRCSTRRRKRRGGREEREGEGARRVQLVRRDGRDVSTLYGREEREGASRAGLARFSEMAPLCYQAEEAGREGGVRRRRGEMCPVSTEGWTRRVHFVREGGARSGEGGRQSRGAGRAWRQPLATSATTIPRRAIRSVGVQYCHACGAGGQERLSDPNPARAGARTRPGGSGAGAGRGQSTAPGLAPGSAGRGAEGRDVSG